MTDIKQPLLPATSHQPDVRVFDPALIRFPTDSITLLQMRRRDPQLFTRETLMKCGPLDALATYCFEYMLAVKAFAKAAGQPDPYRNSERSELIAFLNNAYKEYGLSAGIQETRQLIRNVEAAATKQAGSVRTRSS